MAVRSSKPRSRQPESKSPASFLWGLALLCAAVMILLAVVSYSDYDWPGRDAGGTPQNWMGLWGERVAGILCPLFLGRWAAVCIPVLIGILGWALLRRLNWKNPFMLSVWVSALAVWLSTFIALLGDLFVGREYASEYFSHAGQFGVWSASYVQMLLGTLGAAIVLFLVFVIGMALSVAGFAGWFEGGVNSAIDKLAEKKKSFSFFGKKDEDELMDTDDAEETATPFPWEQHSKADGIPGKVIRDLAEPVRKAPARKTGQMVMGVDDNSGYVFPPLDCFREPNPNDEGGMSQADQQRLADLLEKSLDTFGVKAKVVRVNPGPVITRFDLEPAPGVKVAKIESLADDISLALRARGLRILAPIPGQAAVGVEIANPKPQLVTFREVVESESFQSSRSKLTIALGRTVSGEIQCTDLAALPHLLIAGTTGSGKSVCVNAIINSILLRATPEEVQFVMIDPKRIELAAYNELRKHHVTHRADLSEYVITKPDEAVKVLRSCLTEMDRRYDLLAERGSRQLSEYNDAVKAEPRDGDEPLPYLVVVIDELADLMVTAQREVEEPIARLAQMARAVGIHLVVATQRPSVDVITGVIKANFPARIAFRVAMKVDSRTILDTNGAEMLLGQGDMLFQHPEEPAPQRIQGALLTSSEISKVIAHIRQQPAPRNKLELPLDPQEEKDFSGVSMSSTGKDPLFNEAAKIVVITGQGSVSILQRRLKVGYSRAARLIDQLEEAKIVGPFDGSKARAVLADERFIESLDER